MDDRHTTKQKLLSEEHHQLPDDDEQAEIRKARQTNAGTGLTEGEARARLDEYGPNVLVDNKENECLKFLSNFWGPMPIMIWLAILIEGVQENWIDFTVLLVLQILNGSVSYFEEKNAGDAIAALKANLSAKANVKRDGTFKIIEAKYLVPGDIVNVKLGDVVPADCELLGTGGELEVDQAALTGESLPVTVYSGEQLKMGSTIKRGELEAVVCFTGSRTFFGKAAALVASVDQVGRFQKVLFRITMFLLGLALLAVSIILITLLLAHMSWLKAIGICVVLLVASIPIAMQVVSTSTMAVGSRRLAQKKVIVAKLSAIEELAGMDMLCSDKTGTLTQNKLSLFDPILTDCEGGAESAREINLYAGLAAKRIAEGQDAIDYCITQAVERAQPGAFESWEELAFLPFDPVIKRTEATVREGGGGGGGGGGRVLRVTKGAPQVVLAMAHNNAQIRERVLAAVSDLAGRGYRSLGVAHAYVDIDTRDEDVEWVFDGVLSLFDPPREDTEETIRRALQMGIQVKMITGDQTAIAKETARSLGMGTNILSMAELNAIGSTAARDEVIRTADGFAEVFPEHKFMIVESLQSQGFVVGMTGDGVNDAPALKRAQIGVAVEGSTDAARAASDIVLTEPGLSVIIDAILRSRKIFQRVRNYGIYRVACTIQLVFFFFFAITTIEPAKYFCAGLDDPTAVDTRATMAATAATLTPHNGSTTDGGRAFDPANGQHDWSMYGVGSGHLRNSAQCGSIFGAKVTGAEVSYGGVCFVDFVAAYNVGGKTDAAPIKCAERFTAAALDGRLKLPPTDKLRQCPTITYKGVTAAVVRYQPRHNGHCPALYPSAAYPFTIPVIAIVIITILNDVSMITIAHDKVIPASSPQGWRLGEMSIVAAICGFVPCLSSLLLLVAGLLSADGSSDTLFARALGDPVGDGSGAYYLSYSKLIMLLYLKISISDFLTVFSARTEGPFWERRPGYALLTAAMFATTVSSLVAGFARIEDETFAMEPLPPRVVAVVWLYNLVFFLLQDAVKVLTYRAFRGSGGGVVGGQERRGRRQKLDAIEAAGGRGGSRV